MFIYNNQGLILEFNQIIRIFTIIQQPQNEVNMEKSFKKARQPEQIPELFAEAWNNRDADQIAELFEEDAEFVNVVGLWWHNKKEIRKAHDYGLKTIFSESDIKIQKITTKWINEEAAVVHAKIRLMNQTPKDEVQNPQMRQTIFSFVVQKEREHWICLSAHNTDVVPGAETNIVDEDGSLKGKSYRE